MDASLWFTMVYDGSTTLSDALAPDDGPLLVPPASVPQEAVVNNPQPWLSTGLVRSCRECPSTIISFLPHLIIFGPFGVMERIFFRKNPDVFKSGRTSNRFSAAKMTAGFPMIFKGLRVFQRTNSLKESFYYLYLFIITTNPAKNAPEIVHRGVWHPGSAGTGKPQGFPVGAVGKLVP